MVETDNGVIADLSGKGQTMDPSSVAVSGSVARFRGGLVFKAPRLLYHSTLGLRVIKKTRGRVWDRPFW